MFYGLAHNEDYFKDKISVFVALAPVTKITNTPVKVIRTLSKLYEPSSDILNLFRVNSVFTRENAPFEDLICRANPYLCCRF
jgi:hypothetical protein